MHDVKQAVMWVIIIAILLGNAIEHIRAARFGARVRRTEEPANIAHGRVPPLQLSWHLTHTREDVATIAAYLAAIHRSLAWALVLLVAIWAKS